MAVIWEQKGTLSHTHTPTPPSDLFPLTVTGAPTTCSWMIHLLHKCNYITALISDVQRPIPRDASFPNTAEKSTILPRAEVQSQRTIIKYNIFPCSREDWQMSWNIRFGPFRGATFFCLPELLMGRNWYIKRHIYHI